MRLLVPALILSMLAPPGVASAAFPELSAVQRLTTERAVTGGEAGLVVPVIASTYDSHDRLATMSESGRTTLYGYDLAGNIVGQRLGNGQTTTHAHDALDRRQRTTGYADEDQEVADIQYEFLYGHDRAGNLVRIDETMPGLAPRVVEMEYDAIHRLTAERATTGGGPEKVTTYAYDAAGNRTYEGIDTDGDGKTGGKRGHGTNIQFGGEPVRETESRIQEAIYPGDSPALGRPTSGVGEFGR